MSLTSVIPNLFCVDQALNIWRGGQPTDAGWWYLKAQLSIARVIKLNTDKEGTDGMAEILGIKVYRFPIPWWRQVFLRPKQTDLHAAVALIGENTFVHCGSLDRTLNPDAAEDNTQGGEDRTGLLIGCFRLSQGWSKDDAYTEMIGHGFHPVLQGLQGRWESEDPADWVKPTI